MSAFATRKKVNPPRLVAPHQRHRGVLAAPSGHGRPHALSEIFFHRLLISALWFGQKGWRCFRGHHEETTYSRGGRGQVGHGCGRGTKTRSETVSPSGQLTSKRGLACQNAAAGRTSRCLPRRSHVETGADAARCRRSSFFFTACVSHLKPGLKSKMS